MRYLLTTGIAGSLGLFALWFNPQRSQWLVSGLWLLALCLWIVNVRRLERRPCPLSRPPSADVTIASSLLLSFAVAWLPFYDNWRWAFTGDSISWFEIAYNAAIHGIDKNIFSLEGVDGNFTYLHGLAFNLPMFVFEPTFFWHRVGKLLVSCLSLLAVYTFFRLTVGRLCAVAVVVCTAVNYVWLWFSYLSYAHVDSFVLSFSTLTMALLIWRAPDHRLLWMLCGLVGGASLFFTQTAWSEVLLVGVALALFAIATGRVRLMAVYCVSFVLVATPILLQPAGFLKMTTRQAGFVFEWSYLAHIFTAILMLPVTSPHHDLGVQGPFLPAPLGWLYPLGLVAALGALIPACRRRLKGMMIAPIIMGALIWDAVVMTLTNNAYADPSTKRTYHLIPYQVFLALLPLLNATKWAPNRRCRLGALTTITIVVIAYASMSLWKIVHTAPAVYGFNVFDGLIELRQRFPQRRVVLFSSRGLHRRNEKLAPDSFLMRAYRLGDTTWFEERLSAPAVGGAIRNNAFLCYEPAFDGERMQALLEPHRDRLQAVELLNSEEMVCLEKAS